MKTLTVLILIALCCNVSSASQPTFAITGTAIPLDLLKLNYGNVPKGIQAYDLNVCNLTEARHSLTSSEIYQALVESQPSLRPIGRQIMLAAILRNQNHSLRTWLNLGLVSVTGILPVLGTSRSGLPAGALSAATLAAPIAQQLLAIWSPVLTADQVEKFESMVLEPTLLLDGGSCLERTLFTTLDSPPKRSLHPKPLNFSVQRPD